MRREKFVMGNNKSYAMCPNCGTVLLKARVAEGVEVRCQKCKRKYELKLNQEGLLLQELKSTYAATA